MSRRLNWLNEQDSNNLETKKLDTEKNRWRRLVADLLNALSLEWILERRMKENMENYASVEKETSITDTAFANTELTSRELEPEYENALEKLLDTFKESIKKALTNAKNTAQQQIHQLHKSGGLSAAAVKLADTVIDEVFSRKYIAKTVAAAKVYSAEKSSSTLVTEKLNTIEKKIQTSSDEKFVNTLNRVKQEAEADNPKNNIIKVASIRTTSRVLRRSQGGGCSERDLALLTNAILSVERDMHKRISDFVNERQFYYPAGPRSRYPLLFPAPSVRSEKDKFDRELLNLFNHKL